MLDDIRELNETFYELYGRLYENALFLPSKQRDYTYQVLLLEYKAEYARISSENEIERSSENFSVKLRKKALVPKRWWLFGRKNRAAQLIEDEVRAAIEAYFAAKEAEIAEMRKTQAETSVIDGSDVLRNARTAEQVRRLMEAAETPAEQAQGAEANDGTEEAEKAAETAENGAEEAAETAENGAAGAAIPF